MDLVQLFSHETELLETPAGQALFSQGETGELMYILMQGAAEISVNNKVVEIAEPGAILGELALIDDSARSATVLAKTDCRFLPVTRKRFNFLVQQTPYFALDVMRVMAERLRRTDLLL